MRNAINNIKFTHEKFLKMKTKINKKKIAIITVLAIGFVSIIIALTPSNWTVPKELAGNYVSSQKITFREKVNGEYTFTNCNEIVNISIGIDGKVIGFIGNATLKECKIEKNRGSLGRKLNLKTDYRIYGYLDGKINQNDKQTERKISMPFNSEQNKLIGCIFESPDFWSIFPFCDIQLPKAE